MADTQIIVGEEVTVEVDFPSILLPAIYPNQPNTVTFTGKVIPSADYDSKDSMRITGDVLMPVRVIPLTKVLNLNGKPFKYTPKVDPQKPTAAKTVEVPGSKPGTKYVLTIKEDGSKSCSCAGYGFRGTCKHIDNYKG